MKIERWRKDRRGARIVVAIAGGMMGLVLGHIVTLGLVVARAHLFGVYVSTLDDVVGGLAFLTTPIGLLLGVWVVLTNRISAGRVLGVTAGGAVIGCGLGILAGLAVPSGPEGPWAGGMIGAAAGIVAGAGASSKLASNRTDDAVGP